MHLTILTGASRGLGLALTAQLLAAGQRVLAISRHAPEIEVPAGAELVCWTADLAEAAPVAAQLALWLAAQDANAIESATLINNAGVITPPAPLADTAAGDLVNAIRVGLEAPLLLSAAFLQATAGWACPRKLLLVSSGLGRRGMAGATAYCAAKAGMDNLARALALEEAARPQGAGVVSLAPGVIDTDMQLQLRGADPARFAEQKNFAALKAGGRLDTPEQAAAKLLRYLARPDFGAEPMADVRGTP
ncbi:NAD(P)-dependent dehydrogenase (Short-subunit alcohol dehydrogenase family) [Rubrivivax sp. A210]|uniref:SDR family NAD(P)-dependent oxidoreductase n=1 Tax=Rubrivivax sp. A210 TaxID=2772301 RepID=UPI001918AB89|nr:SDR family NAD(P)-dependent oxidoreductase [Rubrivivax sp. A210]CAD5372983.1 NAD(P)-dependent dehydrogenase (Short-subunit alcohol dehydrogenase family) [Rubrivivax sp. A210]